MSHGKAFNRVLIIMFENQDRGYVMANTFFRRLAAQGRDLANYHGVMHPSQPNYIVSIAGELCNVTDDTAPPPLTQRTVVDLIEESPRGLEWKAYMDSYIPQNNEWSADFVPKDEYPYVVKHNPFSSFAGVQKSKERWQRVVSESQLYIDLLNGTLPHYAWFTPNMWNDGHYTYGTHVEPKVRAPALVDQAASWLEGFFASLKFPGSQSHFPEGTLVVVTFDESDFEKYQETCNRYTYDGPNQIYTVLLGDMIEPGTVDHVGYNHYSLLRTIEKNFGLDHLGKNDEHANWFRFLWGERFAWGPPAETPVTSSSGLAAASFDKQLFVVTASAGGELCFRTYASGHWFEERPIGGHFAAGPFALEACSDRLVLVFQGQDGKLASAFYTLEDGWSSVATALPTGAVERLALTSYGDGSELMLVWCEMDGGAIRSLRFVGGKWQEAAVDTGHSTDGDLSLAAIGPSLYLVFEVAGSDYLDAVSYNVADFNLIKVAHKEKYACPDDNTTLHAWSPSAFPVARFYRTMTPGEEEPKPLMETYSGAGPLAMACLDGVIHLVHPGAHNPQLLNETFSISGLMTAKNEVSYDPNTDKTVSNGFGTLKEAGWSVQSSIPGAWLAEEGGMLTLTPFDGDMIMLFQGTTGERIRMCRGSYKGQL